MIRFLLLTTFLGLAASAAIENRALAFEADENAVKTLEDLIAELSERDWPSSTTVASDLDREEDAELSERDWASSTTVASDRESKREELVQTLQDLVIKLAQRDLTSTTFSTPPDRDQELDANLSQREASSTTLSDRDQESKREELVQTLQDLVIKLAQRDMTSTTFSTPPDRDQRDEVQELQELDANLSQRESSSTTLSDRDQDREDVLATLERLVAELSLRDDFTTASTTYSDREERLDAELSERDDSTTSSTTYENREEILERVLAVLREFVGREATSSTAAGSSTTGDYGRMADIGDSQLINGEKLIQLLRDRISV